MRKIKFRAWNGNSMVAPQMTDDIGGLNIAVIDCGKRYGNLMQYTGLLDTTGCEIYEGDIVQCEYYGNALVLFGTPKIEDNEGYDVNQIAGFYLRFIEPNPDRPHITRETHMDRINKVIGNIYENPELMESNGKRV